MLQVCWIRAETEEQRIKMFVLSLYAWQLLSCLVTLVLVLLVSWRDYLSIQHRITVNSLSDTFYPLEAVHNSRTPALHKRWDETLKYVLDLYPFHVAGYACKSQEHIIICQQESRSQVVQRSLYCHCFPSDRLSRSA